MEETWDGQPVAREAPFACCVVVRRWRDGATPEYLVLHRAHFGPDFAGDWAWTPPSGARHPDEEPDAAARRELREETGLLELPLRRLEPLNEDVALYRVDVPPDVEIVLDAEHDGLRWLPLDEAAALCLPAVVADGLRHAAGQA